MTIGDEQRVFGPHNHAHCVQTALARAEGFNGAPPTVYRALDFLLKHGLIHRIESLNAYTGCAHPGAEHCSQFLICSQCSQVAEINDSHVLEAIQLSASKHGFATTGQVVEIRGLCPQCRGSQDG